MGAAPTPLVTVIVPHFNDLTGLNSCLAALTKQVGVSSGQYEIIVCDNDSPIGLEAVKSIVDGRAKVVKTSLRGAGPARNEAVAHAQGKYLAFTDSDCIPGPKWLASGIEALESGSIVGGRMQVSVRDNDNLSGAEAFERVFAFQNQRYVEDEGFTVTANLFCTKECFDRVGPFRVLVSEDKDWCQRATSMGYSIIFASDAVVSHPARRDWSSLVKKWERIDLETFNLGIEKSPYFRWFWLAKAWLLPFSILPHALLCLKGDTLGGGSVRVLAIATLFRIRLWRFGHYHRLAFAKQEISNSPNLASDSKK